MRKLIGREKFIWLSALMDGEGSVFIGVEDTAKDNKRKLSISIKPMLRIAMADKAVIDEVAHLFGGQQGRYERWDKGKTRQYEDSYAWTYQGFRGMKELVRAILPFSIVKKERLAVLLELCLFYEKLIARPLKGFLLLS